MMTKDLNYKSVMYSSGITVEPTETEGVYALGNVYGLDAVIDMKIDLQTGEVLIPQQKIYQHTSYGEVSMVPMLIKEGKFYTVEGDLKGTLQSDGYDCARHMGCHGNADAGSKRRIAEVSQLGTYFQCILRQRMGCSQHRGSLLQYFPEQAHDV